MRRRSGAGAAEPSSSSSFSSSSSSSSSSSPLSLRRGHELVDELDQAFESKAKEVATIAGRSVGSDARAITAAALGELRLQLFGFLRERVSPVSAAGGDEAPPEEKLDRDLARRVESAQKEAARLGAEVSAARERARAVVPAAIRARLDKRLRMLSSAVVAAVAAGEDEEEGSGSGKKKGGRTSDRAAALRRMSSMSGGGVGGGPKVTAADATERLRVAATEAADSIAAARALAATLDVEVSKTNDSLVVLEKRGAKRQRGGDVAPK